MAAVAHPDEVRDVHARVLAASPAEGRHVDLASGRQAHVIEVGDGPPLVLVHSGGTSALLFLPLLDRLTGVHAIAVDRPGFGLSDPIEVTRDGFRAGVVAWMGELFDALGLDETALLGNSIGELGRCGMRLPILSASVGWCWPGRFRCWRVPGYRHRCG